MKIYVPPLKSQGIKTKLVPWIKSIIPENFSGTWIEPFMGTGVVAFNIAPNKAILSDTNPYLIRFYNAILHKEITPNIVKKYLEKEGKELLEKGEKHYYYIRERFNEKHSSLDFLFLTRAGFNGMIRFNKKGNYNVPFCRKPQRFSQSYITKIVNQVNYVFHLLQMKDFKFICQDFSKTVNMAKSNDIIYCDPPYIGRYADYFNGWNDNQEQKLFQILSSTSSLFILSTWHHNIYRKNSYIKKLWNTFNILKKEHFYHLGGKEKNRNSIVEALITNFIATSNLHEDNKSEQLLLFQSKLDDKPISLNH